MKAFNALSLRERALIISMAVLGLVMALYLYAWEPAQQRLVSLRDQKLPESAQTLAWVRQALESAKNQPANKREARIDGPLLTVIEQTAEKAGVRASIRRMQPNQSQEVKIWLDEVTFDAWMNWIELLRQQYVVVDRASIAMASSGIVNIRMTVARH